LLPRQPGFSRSRRKPSLCAAFQLGTSIAFILLADTRKETVDASWNYWPAIAGNWVRPMKTNVKTLLIGAFFSFATLGLLGCADTSNTSAPYTPPATSNDYSSTSTTYSTTTPYSTTYSTTSPATTVTTYPSTVTTYPTAANKTTTTTRYNDGTVTKRTTTDYSPSYDSSYSYTSSQPPYTTTVVENPPVIEAPAMTTTRTTTTTTNDDGTVSKSTTTTTSPNY
jgi:hypothetical protein